MTILNIEDLCFDNTTFGKPVKGNGFYSMRVTHNKESPEPIFLQTPKMTLVSNILDTKFLDIHTKSTRTTFNRLTIRCYRS